MFETVAFAGIIITTFLVTSIRIEHRVTKVEDKMDVLLKKNGIEPMDCTKKKGGKYG